jgi:hypothetical protein
MIQYGPVGEAAHQGHNSPAFDLIVGFGILALIWLGSFRRKERRRTSIWIAIAISVICAVFIYSGIKGLLH